MGNNTPATVLSELESEYAFEHWQQDAFFTFQFLNGLNPILIHYCCCLPKNFPVTDTVLAPLLGHQTSLQAELEKRSLYLVVHAIFSGLHSSIINGKPQLMAVPLTLLHQHPSAGLLLPLTFQISS
ncbi:Arachidonate 15-lipoxygenase B [Fukomys damarensis]|uniref:Arachidonate 15-lipoxygenase B n=1 Tax=Fukomys damarensis TaxID=885580 RepID=A0A091CN00_FUKDA|nr:Arachidonate 15-lipoxygenase B [Fukomys damarensis]